jgi:hypothetical protein
MGFPIGWTSLNLLGSSGIVKFQQWQQWHGECFLSLVKNKQEVAMKRYRKDKQKEILTEWRNSGKALDEFCGSKDLDLKRVKVWIESENDVVEVPTNKDVPVEAPITKLPDITLKHLALTFYGLMEKDGGPDYLKESLKRFILTP